MTIAFRDDMATLDPAIGYDNNNWPIIRSIFNCLLDYVPGTTTLRPMLAESYTVSPDNLVYTFKLRPGVTFQNGRPLVAQDFVYSLTRVMTPKTASPGLAFFAAVDGYDAFVHGRADHVAGLQAPDPATVVIRLSHPSAPFLQAVALNFAAAVPREEVERPGNDFGRHPVGTGAFRLDEWLPGSRLTLRRNPHYFEPNIPHLDRLVVEIGQEPLTELLQLQHGDIDVLGDDIPPAKFIEVMHDPSLQGQIVHGQKLETNYLAIKVGQKPFDDLRVRLALEHAINKARIVKLLNSRDLATGQVLPPGMPGYDPNDKGYDYNPDEARALLKQAGYPDGFSTTLYAINTDPQPRIAQAIQQDLAAVGIKADLRMQALQTVNAAAGSPAAAPLVWSGGDAWVDDFPDPSDFYTPTLSCGSAVPGGWNWPFYCNHDLDRAAIAADAIADPARADERLAAWRGIFAKIMQDAPWVPILNTRYYVLKSRRLAGPDALMTDPIYTPINYAYVWVTDGR